jgi:hypothetical protein
LDLEWAVQSPPVRNWIWNGRCSHHLFEMEFGIGGVSYQSRACEIEKCEWWSSPARVKSKNASGGGPRVRN